MIEAHRCRTAMGPCMDGSPLARGNLSVRSCWLVRPCIRPVDAAFHAPRAIMPFARLRSRSKARIRDARPQWVFLIRRFQPALCISSCPPFPTSSAMARPVSSMRCSAPDSAHRLSLTPRPSAQFCWRARPLQPWSFAGPSVAQAMGAWSRSARRSGSPPSRRPRATGADSDFRLWRCCRAPLEFCLGTSPIQAERHRPDLNA